MKKAEKQKRNLAKR